MSVPKKKLITAINTDFVLILALGTTNAYRSLHSIVFKCIRLNFFNATCAPQDFLKKSPLPHGDKPKKNPLFKKSLRKKLLA